MKGWEWALLAVGTLLALGAGAVLFLQYYPAYSPAYIAWKKANPGAPRIQYELDTAGRKNSDGGGTGSSLKSGGSLK